MYIRSINLTAQHRLYDWELEDCTNAQHRLYEWGLYKCRGHLPCDCCMSSVLPNAYEDISVWRLDTYTVWRLVTHTVWRFITHILCDCSPNADEDISVRRFVNRIPARANVTLLFIDFNLADSPSSGNGISVSFQFNIKLKSSYEKLGELNCSVLWI